MEYTKGEWKQGKRHADTIYMADENTRIATCFSPNAEANAQLIAAAPELYEVLGHLVWRIEKGLALGEKLELKPARAALAKAEGK